MNDEMTEYEEACSKIEKENEVYLQEFLVSLKNAGLGEKTISRHISNIDFYLNTFVVRLSPKKMEEGCGMINDYLGDFFIRKCTWSTPASIKSTAGSIKKFYKVMLENGHISKETYEELADTIKNCMDEWQETCAQYNDPNSENPFFFGF